MTVRVEAALKRRAKDGSQRVIVSVDGHDVTLGGSVHRWAEKDLAARSDWRTPSVCSVVDNRAIV